MRQASWKSIPGIASWALLFAVQVSAWSGEVELRDAPTVLGPGITVDVKRHEVRMEATVCLRRGILEYLICRTRTFEHESIFATTCKPSQLHTALLIIGADPYPFMIDDEWSINARKHTVSRLSIEVEFDQEGVLQRRRIGDFLVNRERKDGVVDDSWIFTGSAFYNQDGKEYYAADSTGAVIGLTPKGASVVQYGERIGVPYQGEDQGMEIKLDTLPPAGATVSVIFSLHGGKQKGEVQTDRPAGTIPP